MATKRCTRRVHRQIATHFHRYNQRWFSTPQPIKKYGVLVTGGPPEHIQEFGDYGDMMINMLSDTNKDEEWHKYYCFEGDFPNNEMLQDLSGVVITGSRFNAHADDEWICKLRETVRHIYETNNENCRLLGICFGHQLVANALEGASGPASSGWQLGMQPVTFNEDFYKLFPEMKSAKFASLPILKLHKDQVTELPANATLLASSWNVAYEMYSIGHNVLCVQGHPEFDSEYLRQVVDYRNRAGIIPDQVTDICFESLAEMELFNRNIKLWHGLLRSWLVQ